MEEEIIIIEEPEQVVEIIDAEAESEKAVVVTPESEIKRFESALSAINSRLTAQEEFNKEVTYTESVDTDIAYEKAIPTSARLGFINKIGGMSRKGINLFDFSKQTDSRAGITSFDFSDDTLTVVGNDTSTYSSVGWNCTELVKRLQGKYVNFSVDSFTFSNTDARPTIQFVVYTDDGTKYLSILNKSFQTGTRVLIPTGNITSAKLGIYTNNDNTRLANTITLVKPMVLLDEDKGKPYEPYTDGLVTSQVESVSIDGKAVPIPSELRKPMYGINETVYDYIDVEQKTLVRKCGIVDVGTLRAIKASGCFYSKLPSDAKVTRATDFVCKDYVNSGNVSIPSGMGMMTAQIKNDGYIYFVPSATYTTVEEFIDSVRGMMLVYELETPVIEDLSGVLQCADIANPFNCNGGTITFNQTQQQKVEIPNEVRYLTKSEGLNDEHKEN